MQTNCTCNFRDGRGLFLVSRFNPAALWYKRCKALLVLKVTKWKRQKFPQKFSSHWWQLGITFPNYILVPILIYLHEIAFITPASLNEYPVVCLSNSQRMFISQLFLSSCSRGGKKFFFMETCICARLCPHPVVLGLLEPA